MLARVVRAALAVALDHVVDERRVDQRAVAGDLDDQLGVVGLGGARARAPSTSSSLPRKQPMPSRSASSCDRVRARVLGGRDDDLVEWRARRRRSTIAPAAACPAAGSSTLPGRREEVMRASIVATTRSMRCTLASGAVAIPYGRQSITEEDVQAVVDVLRSRPADAGPRDRRRFEQEFAAAVDAPYAVAFSSGTAALHAAAWAAGLGPGRRAADERDHVRRERQLRRLRRRHAALRRHRRRTTWNVPARPSPPR